MNKPDIKPNIFYSILSVKRIIAFSLTLVFCILSLEGIIKSNEFLTIFSMVVAFYFGQSVGRKVNETHNVE